VTPDFDAAAEDRIEDDLLRLIFTSCHPVLPVTGRVALTLRLLGGLTAAEIARGYLLPEPAIAQRIVRAKKTLGAAGLSYEVPRGAERNERLASVLEVIYLIFNEGYAATAGEDPAPSLRERLNCYLTTRRIEVPDDAYRSVRRLLDMRPPITAITIVACPTDFSSW
jgi:predicted RNA polymerase sigma factor